LIWLLDYLRGHKEHMSRLALVQSDSPISDQSPDELARSQTLAIRILDQHLDLASMAWRAYCAPTPTAWRDLLDPDLIILPRLRQSVVELLAELPSSTAGLGATEMRMLELISAGRSTPSQIFSDRRRRVFDYWEIGDVLDGLARCPAPAMSGLNEGPFRDVYLHRERAER